MNDIRSTLSAQACAPTLCPDLSVESGTLDGGGEDRIMSGQPDHELFVFLGRRGAISRWVPDITELTAGRAAVVVSRQNEIYNQIRNSGPNIVKVDTFDSILGAIWHLPRIFSIRRKICHLIRTRGITRVVILMSHIWTPFLARAVR